VIDGGNSGYKRQKIQNEEEAKLPEISPNDDLQLARDDADSADEEWPQYGDDDANEWDDYGCEDDAETPERTNASAQAVESSYSKRKEKSQEYKIIKPDEIEKMIPPIV
jgi:hypothetical protein